MTDGSQSTHSLVPVRPSLAAPRLVLSFTVMLFTAGYADDRDSAQEEDYNSSLEVLGQQLYDYEEDYRLPQKLKS